MKNLFIVFSQYQLLNVINLVINKHNNDKLNNDILIDKKVYEVLPKDYKSYLRQLFYYIYEADCYKTNKFSLKLVKELSSKKACTPLYLFIFLKNIFIEKLAELLYKIDKLYFLKLRIHYTFNPKKYGDIYLYNTPIIIKTIFKILYKNKVRTLHLIDDGLSSYVSRSQVEYFTNTYKGVSIKLHLYAPEFLLYADPNVQIIPMPKLSSKNIRTLEYLNLVFGYDSIGSIDAKDFCVVILDQHIEKYFKGSVKKVFDLKIDLYKIAFSIYNQSIFLKPHPLFLKDSLNKNFTNIMNTSIPFELIILNTNNCPAIITISSTAAFAPFISIDNLLSEYKLIILDKILKLDQVNDPIMLKIPILLDKLYKKFKFYRPRTIDEYRNLLIMESIKQ